MKKNLNSQLKKLLTLLLDKLNKFNLILNIKKKCQVENLGLL
jgi:hypothetical protein